MIAFAASVLLAQAPPPIRFEDVTASSGIAATMTSGSLPSRQIVEVKGGGLALIDFDGDGDHDLFMPNGATVADPEHGPGARLFENLGGLLEARTEKDWTPTLPMSKAAPVSKMRHASFRSRVRPAASAVRRLA